MTSDRRRIDRDIAAIAIPASLALLTDPLYGLSDTAILGHIGSAQLGGAALAIHVLTLGYALFVFLMFSTTAAVARHLGAGHEREATNEAIGGVWVALLLGCIGAAVMGATGRQILHAMGAKGDVARHAWTYLRFSLAGLPAFMIVMVGVGFHRGNRDTRTPLAIAAATVTLNLIIEVVAVFGFHFGVGASAIGTVIAKWVGAAIYLLLIGRTSARNGASWRPRIATVVRHLRVGGDLVARTLILLGVITVAQSAAARLGTATLAGHAIAFELWTFGAFALDGIEVAGQALVAHELGANRPEAVVAVATRVVRWALVIGGLLGLLIAATAWVSPLIFSSDPAVLALATVAVLWVAALQPVNSAAFALDGLMVGLGEQRNMAIIAAIAAVGFGATGYALALALPELEPRTGISIIWASFSVFMIVRAVGGFVSLRRPRGVMNSVTTSTT